jgi:ribosome-associated protein
MRYVRSLSGGGIILTLNRCRRWAGSAVCQEERVLTEHHRADHGSATPIGGPEALDGLDAAHPLLSTILVSLDDDNAEDVVVIPLAGKSDLADHMVVASGRSTRQVAAIADKLSDRLKQAFGLSVRSEGADVGDWVLIDAGDVIVHIFRPEVRDFYQLEKMWLPARRASGSDT